MPQRAEVIAYAGYRGEQEPRALVVDGRRLEVAEVRRRWIAPDGRFFEVRLADRRTFVLRLAEEDSSWSIVRQRMG